MDYDNQIVGEVLGKIKHRTRKINIVLISGKALAGKSTTAKYLYEHLNLLTELAPLAQPIKDEAGDFFGWDGQKDERGRKLLQDIGDAAINYDKYAFAKKVEDRVLNGVFMPYFVFIDDWRYPAEKEYFDKNFLYEITTIRIERSQTINGSVAQHRSENSLPVAEFEHLNKDTSDSTYDFVVYNNGSLEDLFKKLDSIVSYFDTKIVAY
jgi:dephospho-CoA kinase